MVQTLEAIRGGDGSVKVGTTGKISALMSREIESAKTPTLCTSVAVSASGVAPRKLNSRTSFDEASSSAAVNSESSKRPEPERKTKHRTRRTHHIPMLAGDNMSLDGTPIREKPNRRGLGLVEIVDIKCGKPEKTWTNPITNRLKKLGFSKLSESIG